jgi:hypothetical protein
MVLPGHPKILLRVTIGIASHTAMESLLPLQLVALATEL